MNSETIRKTKIVCTIGPASENKIEEMINAGMNVARINFSHGSYDEQREKTERIIKARKEMGVPLALLLDMQGPEVRTGKLKELNVKVILEEGNDFLLVNDEILGDASKTSVSYKELYKDVSPGDLILLDDGLIELKVIEIVDKDIKCKIMNSGALGSRKGINIPGIPLKLPALKEKDIQDIIDGANANYDYIAASFVRSKEDVIAVREILNANGGENIKIISKIENKQGIENIQEILDHSDGLMVARGDLSVEIPFEDVPFYQKKLIKLSNTAMKPVITATQMLESMTNNPLPTRAEVSDVANAVFDRTSAIMLSGESAMGKYPVKCVETMNKISRRSEPSISYNSEFEICPVNKCDIEVEIAISTIETAVNMKGKINSIVCYTNTGNSARRLAGLGAKKHIYAITDNEKTYHQLALIWNVTPILIIGADSIDDTIDKGFEELLKRNYLEKTDTVILSGGSEEIKNTTKSKKIASVVTL